MIDREVAWHPSPPRAMGHGPQHPEAGERSNAVPGLPVAAQHTRRPGRVVIVGAVVLLGLALLAAGVPTSTLITLGVLGGCLGMHLFMDHGSHGGHAHPPVESTGAGQPVPHTGAVQAGGSSDR